MEEVEQLIVLVFFQLTSWSSFYEILSTPTKSPYIGSPTGVYLRNCRSRLATYNFSRTKSSHVCHFNLTDFLFL